jgi:hypothetical protein
MDPMPDAPPGFTRAADGGAETVLRADVAAALRAAGIGDPEALRGSASAGYAGRGSAFGLDVPGAGAVFVRPYLHGGWLRAVTGDLHAGDGRFDAELRAHLDAAAAGVPVCEALGYVARPAGLGLRRGWLLLRELRGARDLLAFLESAPAPRERRRVLEKAGRAIRALHDAGFEHADLHLANLLLDSSGTVRVLDLDRARRHATLSRERRLAGLFRFDRHAAKRRAAGADVTRTDRLRVLRAYAGPGWPGRDEVRALAARLRRHIARHATLRRGGPSSAPAPGAPAPGAPAPGAVT